MQNTCITFSSDPTCVVNFNRTTPVSENATIKSSNKKIISNFNIIHEALKNSLRVFKEIIHTIRSSKKSQLFLPSLPALEKHAL